MKKIRLEDLEASIARGNHKSCAKPQLEKSLDENIAKELRRGYLIPLPVKYLKHLKNVGVIPMGMQYNLQSMKKGKGPQSPDLVMTSAFPWNLATQ